MMPEENASGGLLDDVRLRVGGCDDLYTTHGDHDVAYNATPDVHAKLRRGWSESSEEDVLQGRKEEASELVKPLMSPRQRTKRKPCRTTRRLSILHVLAWRILYCILFVAFLAIFAYLVVYLVNHYGDQWLLGDQKSSSSVIGCDRISVEDVWVRGIPKLMTESAFRLLDINNDGFLDVVFGFATGYSDRNNAACSEHLYHLAKCHIGRSPHSLHCRLISSFRPAACALVGVIMFCYVQGLQITFLILLYVTMQTGTTM